MLFKLSYKNIRKSMKDYVIFFFTLILGVMIFYIFSALVKQTAVLDIGDAGGQISDIFKEAMDKINIFISVVLGLLIVYASGFLMKRRKKEFAVYMVLGMKKRKVALIMFYETIIIGAISLCVGLLLGVLASQGMSVLVINLFEADMSKFKFVISYGAIGKTILYFALMYLVVVVFEVVVVGKAKLINLLSASKKAERKTNKNPYVCFLIFLCSFGLLSHGYWLIFKEKWIEGNNFTIIFIEVCVGTILLFFSLSGLIIFLSKRNKKFYFKGLRMFSSKEVSSRVNTNILSGSVICIMMFFTLCILSSCFAMRNSLNEKLEKNVTSDVVMMYNLQDDINNKYKDEITVEQNEEKIGSGITIRSDQTSFEAIEKHYDEMKDNSIEKKLEEKNVKDVFSKTNSAWTYTMKDFTLSDYLKDVKEADKYRNDKMSNAFMSMTAENIIKLSEYNQMAKARKIKEFTLNDNEYIVLCNYEKIKEMRDLGLKNNVSITIGDKTYVPKYNECQKETIQMSSNDMEIGTIIVPDSVDMTNLYKSINYMVASYNNNANVDSKYNSVSDYVGSEDFMKMLNDISDDENEEEGPKYNYFVDTKENIRKNAVSLVAIVVFVGIYIGIIFMITSAAILALKSLTDATDNTGKYSILRRIGVKERMLNRSLLVQNILFFGMPVLLATLHSVYGIKMVKYIVTLAGLSVSGESITYGVILMLAIYGLYFAATNLTCKKIISERVEE